MRPIIIASCFTLAASVASAQPAPSNDHGYVSAGADFFVGAASFGDTVHPIDFGEAAVINTTYQRKLAPGIDVGGGARVWRSLSLGIEGSRVTKSDSGSVDAQMPHPFFFGRPRAVSGTPSGLSRDETAIHVQARWLVPMRPRWQLAIGGGPSWLSVGQDLVQDVNVTQTYPFDTATFASVTTQRVTKSRVGFNATADVTFLLRPHVGVGVSSTFSHAHIPLTDSAATDAGGLHVSGGLRFRF
jgi:outer membrane protein with beta-barrel domain